MTGEQVAVWVLLGCSWALIFARRLYEDAVARLRLTMLAIMFAGMSLTASIFAMLRS